MLHQHSHLFFPSFFRSLSATFPRSALLYSHPSPPSPSPSPLTSDPRDRRRPGLPRLQQELPDPVGHSQHPTRRDRGLSDEQRGRSRRARELRRERGRERERDSKMGQRVCGDVRDPSWRPWILGPRQAPPRAVAPPGPWSAAPAHQGRTGWGRTPGRRKAAEDASAWQPFGEDGE